MATSMHNVKIETGMMDFWNYKLARPATCTLAVFPTQNQTDILQKASATLAAMVKHLTAQQQLSSELFVLNRLLYMKHGQFRREKTYQGLKQIRNCVKRYLSYGLAKIAKDYCADFESAILKEGIQAYLPSCQMWEYLLTHFLGAAALLSSTANRCETVFLHAYRHLKAGHLIPTNMAFLTLLSRIWVCYKSMLLDLQKWYSNLRPVLDVLAPTGSAWLPEGYTLPDDLTTWMSENDFSTGHVVRERDADDITSLLEQYAQAEDGAAEDESFALQNASDVHDQSLPELDVSLQNASGMLSDDFGDPVSVSDVDVEMDTTARVGVTAEGLIGLKKKTKKAATVRDLQLLLKRFGKRFPQHTTAKKRKKCAAFLASLELKAGVMEVKGKQGRVQQLLIQGRKKLVRLMDSMKSNKQGAVSAKRNDVFKTAKKRRKSAPKVQHEEISDVVEKKTKKKKSDVAEKITNKNKKNQFGDSQYVSLAESKKKSLNLQTSNGTKKKLKRKKQLQTPTERPQMHSKQEKTATEETPVKKKRKNTTKTDFMAKKKQKLSENVDSTTVVKQKKKQAKTQRAVQNKQGGKKKKRIVK